jgi:hypothetical protein
MANVKRLVGPLAVIRTEKVKLLKGVVMGPGEDGRAGDIYELPKYLATQLIAHGQAELTDEGDPLEHDETPAAEKGVPYSTVTIESPTTRDPKPAKRGRVPNADIERGDNS